MSWSCVVEIGRQCPCVRVKNEVSSRDMDGIKVVPRVNRPFEKKDDFFMERVMRMNQEDRRRCEAFASL